MATIIATPRSQTLHTLELRLSTLAYEWRSAKTPQLAQAFVEEYHAVVAHMHQLGWDGVGLSVDAELPEELMPEL